jgi:hypothetical protein
MIRHGAICAEFERSRPGTEWELNNWVASDDPDAVSLPSIYVCEICADLFFSFIELGFNCVSPFENKIKLAKTYHELYQRKKNE